MKIKINYSSKKFVVLVAILCCLLWGSAYPSIKIGYVLFHIPNGNIPSELVFAGYRFILAGIIVLFVAQMSGRKIFSITKANIKQLFILGVLQTLLEYVFFYIGLANTTGAKGSIMNATGTFFSVIIAHFIYKDDRLHFRKILGCLLGFLGVMIINFNSSLLNFSFNFVGDGFLIIAALFFSIGSIYSKKLSKSMDVMVITGYNLFIGGALLAALGLSFGGNISHFTLESTSLLIYMALLSAGAFTLWTQLLKFNKVSLVSIFYFLIPVFGVILSGIFLSENIFEVRYAFALILVSLGILAVNLE